MPQIEITEFLASYKLWNIRWQSAMDEWWPKVSDILVEHLRERVPYDESPGRDESKPHLRDNLELVGHANISGTMAQVEFWGPELAALLEHGADPHDIEGNPYLSFFFEDGDEMVTESVDHPGFDPIPFVAQAYRDSRDEIQKTFRDIMALNVAVR